MRVQTLAPALRARSARRGREAPGAHQASAGAGIANQQIGKSAIRDQRSTIRNPQSGASLVEILVAVAIIASALVIFIAGLATGAFAVRTSNMLTTANNLAASELESIKAAPYPVAGYQKIDPSGNYTLTVTSRVIVTGLQQVTVTVSYQGGSVVVSNYKVQR